jgi:predicted phage terminase large subunit-like protein
MSKITAESILQIKKKCQLNLVAFRHILLNNADEVEPAEFHYDWSNSLLHGVDNEAIEAFRESAKTNYVTRAFPLYALTFPDRKRDYIVIVKKNATLASNKLKEIEEEYLSNEVAKSNLVKIHQQSGDCFSVDVKDENGEVINVRIEAYGKGASIRGLANKDRRPKICIVDDPQDTDDASSQVALESDWNWFLSNVIFLGQTTRVFLIGNNLGEKCIIERVISMDGQLESIKFNSKRIAALTEDGKSAWEAKRSVAEIELEKEDFRRLGKLDIWLREKMCQAVGEELRAFDPQDYRYFPFSDTEKILAQCNRFGVLDPASSPEMTSCYRAIVVVGCNSDNHWFVADVPFGRWDSAQMIDEIFGAVQKYEIQDFGIEKGIFKQVLEPFIYKEMARRNVFFNIVPIEHAKRGSKLERIKMLQPRFKAHQVWFPNEAKWLAELQLELAGVTKDAIKSLYSDLMDALAMIPQIVKVPGKKNISGISKARNPQPVAEVRLI